MSDDLVKLGWKIRSEELAEVDTPFGSYGVKDYAENGWRWFYCFDTYFDNDVLPCEDMAHGMSLAEEHWRDRVQPITKPLTDHIEELEAKLSESEALLEKAVEALSAIEGWSNNPEIEEFARNTLAELSSVSCANTTGGKDGF